MRLRDKGGRGALSEGNDAKHFYPDDKFYHQKLQGIAELKRELDNEKQANKELSEAVRQHAVWAKTVVMR
jgi:hypothetical protein